MWKRLDSSLYPYQCVLCKYLLPDRFPCILFQWYANTINRIFLIFIFCIFNYHHCRHKSYHHCHPDIVYIIWQKLISSFYPYLLILQLLEIHNQFLSTFHHHLLSSNETLFCNIYDIFMIKPLLPIHSRYLETFSLEFSYIEVWLSDQILNH